jgi:5-deoxy-glucuronate isomerase
MTTVPTSAERLLVPSAGTPRPDGSLVQVTPETAGWRHVGFQVFRLREGQRLERQTGGDEHCVVLLAGRCRAVAAGREWADVGGRASVFDGPPHGLYLPAGTTYTLEAITPTVEIAVGTAPMPEAGTNLEPRLITPDDIRVEVRGSGCMERRIHDILMEGQPAAALLVTEVLTPGGHWSSYPPHKHDTDDLPNEAYLEELYYHRLRRERGFALQRVYSHDGTLDVTLAVRDGDCVLVPPGYHPVSAAPGYDLYYLNVMAGPVRQWRVTVDPDLRWLLG